MINNEIMTFRAGDRDDYIMPVAEDACVFVYVCVCVTVCVSNACQVYTSARPTRARHNNTPEIARQAF